MRFFTVLAPEISQPLLMKVSRPLGNIAGGVSLFKSLG